MQQTHSNKEIQAILDSIRYIFQSIRTSSKLCEKECGISSAQLFVLHQLRNKSGISLNELAELTHTHQSSVSVVVSKLVERNLVVRTTSNTDSRKNEISLTAQGLRLINKAPRTVQEILVEVLEKMPSSKRYLLAQLLTQLVIDSDLIQGPAQLLFEDDEKKNSKTELKRRHL